VDNEGERVGQEGSSFPEEKEGKRLLLVELRGAILK
jgi:hypothetical protein